MELMQVDSGVRRVEEDKKENKVVLYFDDIPKKMKRWVSSFVFCR